MDPKFLDILYCPNSGSSLRLEINEKYDNGLIKSGHLISEDGRFRYPIIDGVPRFVDKELYATSFGYEWKKWSTVQFDSNNTGTIMAGYTKKMFEKITGFTPESLKGKLVIDFGCGPGRFIEVARDYGAIVVGIDLSLAVESAHENFKNDPNVLIVQGDILNPPFKKSMFDAGYTIGVLHHTPDPSEGLKKLAETVKKNEPIVCCVYPYVNGDGFYDSPAVSIYRKIINSTKFLFGNRLALLYSYFSAYPLYYLFNQLRPLPILGNLVTILNKYFIPVVYLPDGRWRLLDTFDAITPYYASTHTQQEVIGWFKKINCHDILQTNWCTTSIKGLKG